MNPFRRDEPPLITDPVSHAGNYRGEKNLLKYWELRDPTQEPFDSILRDVGEALSKCRSIPRSTKLLWDFFLRGRNLESSTLYLMIAGTEIEPRRKKAVSHVNKLLLPQYPGLKVDHWDWPPHAPDITMFGGGSLMTRNALLYRCSSFDIVSLAVLDAKSPGGLTYDHGRPLLGIVVRDRLGHGERTGVLSCVFETASGHFLLAPAHLFLPRPPAEIEEYDDTDMDDSESDPGSERLRAASATPPDLHMVSPSSSNLAVIDSTIAIQTREKDSIWRDPEIRGADLAKSTQQLQDSKLFETFSPEHDCALIPMPRDLAFLHQLTDLSLETPARIEQGPFAVSVTTPSCGWQSGWMDGRPTYMRLPYCEKPTRVYPIQFPHALSEGDCGSAVLDKDTNKIYGFIVAGSVEGRVAYIIPAGAILEDLQLDIGKSCKRPLEHDIKDEEDEDRQESGKRPRKRLRESNTQPTDKERWACPFAKRDPVDYARCHGHFATRVTGIREHILRNHHFECPRCRGTFQEEREHHQHMREPAVCKVSTDPAPKSLMAERIQALKRRESPRLSSEESWWHIYEILFPDEPKPESPYVDHGIARELDEFRDFMSNSAAELIQLSFKERFFTSLSEDDDLLRNLLQTTIEDGLKAITDRWSTGLQTPEQGAAPTDGEPFASPSVLAEPGEIAQTLPIRESEEMQPLVSSHMIRSSAAIHDAFPWDDEVLFDIPMTPQQSSDPPEMISRVDFPDLEAPCAWAENADPDQSTIAAGAWAEDTFYIDDGVSGFSRQD